MPIQYINQNKQPKYYFEDSSSLPTSLETDPNPLESDVQKDLLREGFSAAQVSEVLGRMKEESIVEEGLSKSNVNFKRIFTEPLIANSTLDIEASKVDQIKKLSYLDNQDMVRESANIKL